MLLDLGTHDETAVDYPDFARAVAEAVAEGRADLGVCIDGAGIGSAMTANKVPGVRAANCWDVASARNAREHNYANVLTLGGRWLSPLGASEILAAFLSTPRGEERHGRRHWRQHRPLGLSPLIPAGRPVLGPLRRHP